MSDFDTIPLDAVRINGGTQSRAELNQGAIADYTETIRAGTDLPPVVAFFDGATFWLADGFHRYHAHKAAGAMEIAADIRTGTQRDAILFSVGANASHGLRRTNEDKRRAVLTLLNDAEWAAWSANEIAQRCGVSHTFVNGIRASIESVSSEKPVERTYTTKHGTTATMSTVNIGKAKPAEVLPPAVPSPEVIAPPASVEEAAVAVSVELSSEVVALREQVEELAESLKSTLADNEMMGRVFDADDRIKAAMDEAVRQKAIAENAERTLAAKSGEFVERARAVTYWKNRAEKAEKALKAMEAES